MTRDYGALAASVGLTLCRDCPDHDHAFGGAAPGVVHFSASSSWPSTKRFLKLCSLALHPDLRDPNAPLWLYVYRVNLVAREVGRTMGIRVPSRYLKTDRYVVLAGVAGIANDVPMRKRAFDWARR